MHKNIVIILVSVLVVGGLVLCLGRIWPQPPAREAGQEIYRQIEQARHQWRQARDLLAVPVYEGPTETDEITPLPDAVNPKVWTVIEHADEALAETLRQRPEADAGTRSMGFQMLAEINKLKGAYHAERAAIARRTADADFRAADDELGSIVFGRGAVEYQQMLARNALEGVSNEEVVSIRDQTTASLQTANDSLTEIMAALDELQQGVTLRTNRINELAVEEMNLRGQSRVSSSAVESRDLLKMAHQIKAQMNELANEVDELDRTIDLARQHERLIRKEIESLNNHLAAAENTLAARRGQAQEMTAEGERIAQVVSVAEEEMIAALRELQAHCDQAREANLEALTYYGKALDNVVQALRETGGGDPVLLARKAQLLALIAKTRMTDRDLQQRLDMLAEQVAHPYGETVPSEMATELAGVRDHVADAAEEDTATVSELGEARDLLERVSSSARGGQRANYLGQLAKVYFLLYEMTGKDSDRTQGEQRLLDARGARETPLPDDPLDLIQPIGTPVEPPVEPAVETPVEPEDPAAD